MGRIPTVFSEADKHKPVRHRRCCCCSCLVCSSATLIIMIALAIILFFISPRMPEVELVGVKQTALPKVQPNLSSFTSSFNATVKVDNPNYVSWHMNRVEANLYDDESGEKIGTGLLEDFPLNKRDTQLFELPMDLAYSGAPNNTVTLRFASICKGKPMAATLRTKMFVSGLSWLYAPTITRSLPMTCPKSA